MDRLMVYPGAIPLDTDVLSVERNVMKALGWLTQATMGTGTGVIGLPCNPTVPASMTVNVGPGAIWAQAQIDQASFGSLPADASPLMKMGILSEAAGTNFTLTPPATSGQSINYLIEAAFEETDAAPVVLPYVNPANPAQPFTGPDNAGTPQNTVRAQLVDLQMKAGVAANTGTQVTPNVDAGYVGLYVITVNFGQTVVVAENITLYESAPFLAGPFAPLAGNANQPFSVGPAAQPAQAPQTGQIQAGVLQYAADTSTTPNQIVVAITPAITTLVDGQPLRVRVANNNTGATTVTVNGLGPYAVNSPAGGLTGDWNGELIAGCVYELRYNAATQSFVVVGSGGGVQSGTAFNAAQLNGSRALGQYSWGGGLLSSIPGVSYGQMQMYYREILGTETQVDLQLSGGGEVARTDWIFHQGGRLSLGTTSPQAIEGNDAVVLDQFALTGSAANWQISIPRGPGAGQQYIFFGNLSGSYSGQYVPFPIPFPSGCNIIASSDTGGAVYRFSFENITRFGCNVLCGNQGGAGTEFCAQIIAFGW